MGGQQQSDNSKSRVVIWKVMVFGALVVLFGALGYHFYHLGKSDVDTGVVPHVSARIDVYSSDFNANLHVTVGVDQGVDNDTAEVYVDASHAPPKTQVVIVLSGGVFKASPAFKTYNVYFAKQAIQPWTAMVLTAGQLTSQAKSNIGGIGVNKDVGTDVGGFSLRERAVVITKDGIVVHLPAIGSVPDQLGELHSTDALEQRSSSGKTEFVLAPHLEKDSRLPTVNDTDASKYAGVKGVPETPLFAPGNLRTTAILNDGGDLIRNLRIDISSPQNGSSDGSEFIWQGANNLYPVLTAVNPSAESAHANDLFLAGIFLATAAAAFIAVFQEGPDKWRRRRG
jgi:hypothetical protein